MKGLKTKAQLVKRVEEYIKEGRDQNIVDPDPDSVYTKRKERLDKNKDDNSGIAATQHPLSFPSDGWSADIRRMPFFTRAEMNDHISKSGKRIDPTSKAHSVPTSIRKATTFLNDEYLKGISAASDDNYFYFRSHCYHSFRKNDAPHNKKRNFPTLQTFRQNADFGSLLKKFNPKQSLKAIHRLAACPP